MRRQSDERSDEWVAAYERGRAARDAAAAEPAPAPSAIPGGAT
jgi:hypothetical protein